MGTVLVTNGQLRKTLAVVRSLGRKGARVIVAEETRFNLSRFSKYCAGFLKNPNPAKDPEGFFRWLCHVVETYECDTIFPMDEDSMEIVIAHYTELSALCKILVPSGLETYYAAGDKGNAAFRAKEKKISCPRTEWPSTREEALLAAKNFSVPFVLKPRRSSGSRGIRIIRDETEFEKRYDEVEALYPQPILQEYVEQGIRYDVCLLFDSNSKLQASFVQKEIRHFPLLMGPSTVQESVLKPDLLKTAETFMEGLNWVGIAELEFMEDGDSKELKLMEVNPRFWNSVYLSMLAGVDFPWMVYQLSLGRDVEPHPVYESGIFCKWSLPGDLLHFLANKNRGSMNPPILAGKKQGVYDDIISKEDPLPVLGFFLACLRYVLDIKMWKFMFRR